MVAGERRGRSLDYPTANIQPAGVMSPADGIYAARARQEAVRLNRMGDYDGAREALRSTARRIRGYAGDDPELHRIMSELRTESEQFHRAMPELLERCLCAAGL